MRWWGFGPSGFASSMTEAGFGLSAGGVRSLLNIALVVAFAGLLLGFVAVALFVLIRGE